MTRAAGSTRDAYENSGAPVESIEFQTFKRDFHILRPVLGLMGIDERTPEQAYETISRIPSDERPSITVEEARRVDFARRGWILYRHPDSDLVLDALRHMEQGRLDEAEQILVGYYDNATIIQQMKRLERSTVFERASGVAEKALKAHMQGRRQESVPYTLALTDRLVHQTYLDHYHEGDEEPGPETKARAWDTFAEETVGLKELKGYAKACRSTDRSVDRWGLLDSAVQLMGEHYTDQLTAAKAWSALFSAGEWALHLERNRSGT